MNEKYPFKGEVVGREQEGDFIAEVQSERLKHLCFAPSIDGVGRVLLVGSAGERQKEGDPVELDITSVFEDRLPHYLSSNYRFVDK